MGALVLLGLCLTAAGQTQGREFGPARAPIAFASPGKMADDRTRYAQQSEGEKNPKRCREECLLRRKMCKQSAWSIMYEKPTAIDDPSTHLKDRYKKIERAKARCVTDSQSCEGRC
jgi:hypothetical protein